jgi:TPR repeat protein
LLTALLLLALSAAPAETPPAPQWLEISTAATKVRVVTDSGEKAGKKAALQLAQFDRALQKRFPWIKGADDTPLIVFASADEVMVRSMAPDTTDAEKDNAFSSYLAGPAQHTGALRTDLPETADKDRSPTRGFYRGRVTFLIEGSLGKAAPPWVTRGLITFLSDTVVKDKEVQVGRMTAADGDGAALSAPAPADFFREGRAVDRRFDLLSGLFIHYLLVGDNGRNAGALEPLLLSLAAADAAPAVQPALAKVTSLYAGFPKYLAAKKFQALKLPADPSVTAAGFAVRSLPLAEALMLRAEVLFDLNRPVDARGLLRQVKAADPTLARPLEIEAVLYEREQRSAESKKAIEAAIQMGSKNASLYYRLAQLQWSRTMPKPALLSAQKLLEAARDLSPGDANTLCYLAEIQGDLGLFQPALENAQRGALTAPSEVYAQMALARAQWNAKQTDAALAIAKRALALAKLATQKQRVQEFQTFATKNKRAQAAGTRPYPGQFGPPPSGAFGAARAVAGADRVSAGAARTDSADASAISDCFANRNDAACGRAVPALEAACADKQSTSCVSLGSLHEGGFGMPRDRRKAASFYKNACDLGDKPGCARLAIIEAQGSGGPASVARAKKTLESSCAEKVPEACFGLAQLLQLSGLAADRDRARTLVKSACDLGLAEACAGARSR